MKIKLITAGFFILCLFNINALNVVASTSWTAAFAYAAGIEEVTVLAPAEMLHPAEYELRPMDLWTIDHADFFIYAGYETMMNELQNNMGLETEKTIKIDTAYDWETVEASIRIIAQTAGTQSEAERNISDLRALYSEAAILAADNQLTGKSALVHTFQLPFAELIGLNIIGTFGPKPLTLSQIQEFGESNVELIIDNIHNPVGSPLTEILENSLFIAFINFPGSRGTKTLADVVNFNISALLGE